VRLKKVYNSEDKILNKSQIPNFLSLGRFIAAPVIFYALLNNLFLFSFIVMVIAAITDVLDGYIARKIDGFTDFGSYLDVTADFAIIIIVFLAFVINGWYDPLVLLLIIIMFALFIATSNLKQPIYDPIGKYLGTYLILMIFLSILFFESILINILLLIFVLFCLISVFSRLFYLRGNLKKRSVKER
jgi:CDP-diacylglycerol--glycerol-3-phosphate 3-phosphatidyltransferase/cardiolipin synthase